LPQFDLSAADPIFKQVFNPRITKQFNTAAVLWNDVFEGTGTQISNRGLEIPVHMAPNGVHMWYADGGNLPTGDSEKFNRAIVGFYSYVKPIRWTGAALDAGGGGDATTYAKSLSVNVRNGVIQAIKELNAYSFLDGTGILGKVGAIVTPSTVATWTLDVTGTGDGARYLRPGQFINVYTGTVAPVKFSAQILQVNNTLGAAGTVTNAQGGGAVTLTMNPASSATATAVGDAIVSSQSAGAGAADSFNKVMAGLKVIIDNGTFAVNFQNINRINNPQYNANVIPLSGTPPLTRDHLRRSLWLIQQARGAVDLSKIRIWSHGAQLHAYAEMGWTLKQFNGTAMKMDLGYTAYEWEGVPWVIDTDAPRDTLYFVNKDSMLKVTARKLSFDDRTGSILNRIPTTTGGYADIFEAYLEFRGNLGCEFPNANCVTTGLNVVASGVQGGY
jgi:hypothetical protein